MQGKNLLSTSVEQEWKIQYPHIAHYTTLHGLLGILDSQKLWATHYNFLNDSQEIEHGSKYIDQIYQRTVESSLDMSEDKKRFYIGNPKFLRDLWWPALSPNGTYPEFFITSFCGIPPESEDKTRLGTDGLLSQWRAYGNQGGFALVFNSDQLGTSYNKNIKKCKNHTKDNDTCQDCSIKFSASIFNKVFYDYHDSNIEEYETYSAMELVSKIMIQGDTEKIKEFFNNNLSIWRDHMIGTLTLLTLQKHHGFHEENEIRFTCLNRTERHKEIGGGYFNKSPYSINTKGNAPRLEIEFQRSALNKIIIGPQLNQDKMEILIKHHLESQKIEDIEIIKSSIPFVQNKQ